MTDLVIVSGSIYVTCLDGYVYQTDLEGRVLRKWPYLYDWSVPAAPALAVSNGQVAVASGNNLFFLKN